MIEAKLAVTETARIKQLQFRAFIGQFQLEPTSPLSVRYMYTSPYAHSAGLKYGRLLPGFSICKQPDPLRAFMPCCLLLS